MVDDGVVTLLLGIGPGIFYQSATINEAAAGSSPGACRCSCSRSCGSESASGPRPLVRGGGGARIVKPTGVIAVAAGRGGLVIDAMADRASRGPGDVLRRPAWGIPRHLRRVEPVRDALAVVDYEVVLEALLSFKIVDHLPLADIGSTYTRFLGASAWPPSSRSRPSGSWRQRGA